MCICGRAMCMVFMRRVTSLAAWAVVGAAGGGEVLGEEEGEAEKHGCEFSVSKSGLLMRPSRL